MKYPALGKAVGIIQPFVRQAIYTIFRGAVYCGIIVRKSVLKHVGLDNQRVANPFCQSVIVDSSSEGTASVLLWGVSISDKGSSECS